VRSLSRTFLRTCWRDIALPVVLKWGTLEPLVPEATVLFFYVVVIAYKVSMPIILLQRSASKRGRVSYVCSEPSDCPLSLPNKLSESDWILDRLAGLGGFLTESISIPAECWISVLPVVIGNSRVLRYVRQLDRSAAFPGWTFLNCSVQMIRW
jgi:hypothetical protein